MTNWEYRWWRDNRREIADDWSATRSWIKTNQELVRPLAEQDAAAMFDLDDPLVRMGLEGALGRRGIRALRFLRLLRLTRDEAALMRERGSYGSEWTTEADVCRLLGKPVPDRESFLRERRSKAWAAQLATTKGGVR